MSWLFGNLSDWIDRWVFEAIKGIFDQLLMWSVDLTAPITYWQDGYAIMAHSVVLQVAWSLLALRLVWEIYRLYIVRDISDSSIGASVIFRRLIITAFWIAATGPAVQWVYEFAYASSKAIASVGVELDRLKLISGILEQVMIGLTFGGVLLYGTIFIVFAVGILLIKLQAAIRGVELMIAYVFGPVFALSAISNDDFLATGTLAAWWREVLVCSLTQVVQTLTMLALFNYILATGFEIFHIILSLPIIWVSLKSPSILRQYAYHTGVGKGVSSGATSGLTMTAVRFMTKMPF